MPEPTAIDRRDNQAVRHSGSRMAGVARGVLIAGLCGALAAGASASWAALGEAGSGPVRSEPAGEEWEFEIAPYVWFISLPGEITFLDQSSSIDLSFGDIWERLHFAFMLDADVRRGDFGFSTDLTYAYLETTSEGLLLDYDTKIRQVIFDFACYYEALNLDLGSGASAPRLRLQPLVGGRYLYVGLDVDVEPKVGFLPPRFLQPRLNTAAPILGLRGFLDINDHWNLSFGGDGGGFGVDGMHRTWQAELLGGYRSSFSKLDFNLMIGYKGVGIDHSGDAVEADLIFHGPVLRFGFEF